MIKAFSTKHFDVSCLLEKPVFGGFRCRFHGSLSPNLFSMIGGDSVKGTLNGLLAVVSLVGTIAFFYLYVNGDGSKLFFVLAIIALVLTLAFGGMFLSSRIGKTEDIHITE